MTVVRFETEDALGILTVDNPPLNLLSAAIFSDFEDAINAASTAPIRALLIRSEGPHFMAGADMRLFSGKSTAQARAMFSRALPSFTRLEELPLPTVVQVQGLCLASGLEIVLCADIAVAAESARFAQVERHIGTTTMLGGAQRLAERAGAARAKQIVFDGAQYSAQQFADWNIINHVVPDEELSQRAHELASHYAGGPTLALAADKALIRRYLDNGVRDADQGVLDNGTALFESRDMRTGVAKVLGGGARDIARNTDFEGR